MRFPPLKEQVISYLKCFSSTDVSVTTRVDMGWLVASREEVGVRSCLRCLMWTVKARTKAFQEGAHVFAACPGLDLAKGQKYPPDLMSRRTDVSTHALFGRGPLLSEHGALHGVPEHTAQ